MLRGALVFLLVSLGFAAAASAQDQFVPDAAPHSEAVEKALAPDWLTDDERKDLRVFYGVWDDRDLDSPRRAAQAALLTWNLSDAALRDVNAPLALRADALLKAGHFDEALKLTEGDATPAVVAVRCEALAWKGRVDEALAAAKSIDRFLDAGQAASADEIVAAARAALVRGRLEPRTSSDHQRVLNALGRVRSEFDRLGWPALVIEGELLAEKHHMQPAVKALHEAIALQPRSSEAWFTLGQMAAQSLDFDGAERAIKVLKRINTKHPLAEILSAELDLRRRDAQRAENTLDRLLDSGWSDPSALALRAATSAAQYDFDGAKRWLERLDALTPNHPYGPFIVGVFLADERQYDEAAAQLSEAVRRWPNWADPRIALGGLETQTGRDDRARAALDAATKLDPFDQRAQFYLFLLNELAGYSRIESKHFIIRYEPGLDEVVAKLMPDALDAMSDVVTQRFQHEPTKTVIDLMPDHAKFAVRITGMPRIHTIAACTGPVIAIEVPREGARTKHLGIFDWLKVLRHEYTHTVTLSQTKNRIPHWLTEAAAVSMEMTPRDYPTCQLLARELEAGTLFTLDTINWGFIRPERPQDRQLAYAQGHWMVEFMNERFGESALVRLLELYNTGVTEAKAMPETLGIERAEFERQFMEWARAQVKAWGLSPSPTMDELYAKRRDADPEKAEVYRVALNELLDDTALRLAQQIGTPGDRKRDALPGREWPRPHVVHERLDEGTIARWLLEYPAHPDVLEIAVRQRVRDGAGAAPAEETLELLERYAKARPVDPYPHRQLAKLYLDSGDAARAIPHLAELDIRAEHENAFAVELARLRREQGDVPGALSSIERAVRMNPYDAALRELAAAIAIEAGQLGRAKVHVEALTVLEPDAPQHRKRLERISELLQR